MFGMKNRAREKKKSQEIKAKSVADGEKAIKENDWRRHVGNTCNTHGCGHIQACEVRRNRKKREKIEKMGKN